MKFHLQIWLETLSWSWSWSGVTWTSSFAESNSVTVADIHRSVLPTRDTWGTERGCGREQGWEDEGEGGGDEKW